MREEVEMVTLRSATTSSISLVRSTPFSMLILTSFQNLGNDHMLFLSCLPSEVSVYLTSIYRLTCSHAILILYGY